MWLSQCNQLARPFAGRSIPSDQGEGLGFHFLGGSPWRRAELRVSLRDFRLRERLTAKEGRYGFEGENEDMRLGVRCHLFMYSTEFGAVLRNYFVKTSRLEPSEVRGRESVKPILDS